MTPNMSKPVLLEKLRHIIGRGILQGITSPSPTALGRATDAAQGAVYGAVRSKSITDDNIKALQKMTNEDMFKNVLKMSALGALLGGLGASGYGTDPGEGAARHAAMLGGTEAAVSGLRLLSRR